MFECDEPECKETVVADHHWARKKAQREGWFFHKDGRAHCNEHIPRWVADWRAKKKLEREAAKAE